MKNMLEKVGLEESETEEEKENDKDKGKGGKNQGKGKDKGKLQKMGDSNKNLTGSRIYRESITLKKGDI